MKTLRRILRGRLGRIVTSGLVVTTLHVSADPSTYLTVIQQHQQREEQIRAIAAKMNVDPEFLLNPQGRTKFDWRKLFSFSDEAVVANDQPLEIREAVKRVKDRYALTAADTVLARIAQLSQISLEGKNKGQIRAELQSVLRLIDKDFLPAVKDEAPGVAKSRDNDMRREIKDLRQRVKSVINAPHALDEANLESTLTNLHAAVNGTITVRHAKPRWTKDPFPVKDTYRFANIKPAGPTYDENGTGSNATTPAIVSQSTETPSIARLRPVTTATSAEVTSLANSLGTPAKIFAWVHDNIDWDSYSGVAKGSLGTLQERRGNDWDQAMLLRDLLAARGYDARLEWGRVTLPIAKAMNLVGTEDPLQAANLLATAGFDGLVLTAKNQPVAVQMTHAWVRAFIPYVPNRGATAGTPDTWVRMDPSFKRYEYQQGIAINGKVNWSEDEYLQTSAIRPPAEFYGDKIWNYIRTSNIDCVNLSQVTKAGRITATNYPFVPATLTTKIDSVAGVAQTPPVELMQSVTMTVTDINGAVMSSYTTSLADVWGRKLSITFPPATADDAATIAAYGGLFNTPAYLIKLKPVFSIDDVPVADGSPVAAGAVLDLNTTFRQPNVADDFTHHEVVAGETHAIVLDPGMFPDSLLESRINRLKTLTNEDAQLSEKLYLVGLRYMQHVDDGINFAAGVRWQRPVKRVFEADVRRQIDITYNVAGAAVRLTPAENNIDVSRLLVGIVPINNDLTNRASALALAGLQSSYLEGAIWEEMHSRQGISAAKALLLARIEGQQLQTVTSANVTAVLAAANLSTDVENEIRSAVGQGRIAKIAPNNISLGNWTGTGYILEDPQTGAATYPISGGLAGGSETEEVQAAARDILGSESWLEGSELGAFYDEMLALWGRRGDEEGADGPSTEQSDPVNMASGNMYRGARDFAITARGIPVVLNRTYNSRSLHNGPFGYGWTFTYGEQLIPNPDGSVTYREDDGTEHLFALSGGAFVAPPGKDLGLTAAVGGWTLRSRQGFIATFDTRGLEVSVEDPNGNVVTINRDAAGLPLSVVDATARTVLTFTVANGKITRITDLAGRTVNYAYSGDDLISVTDTAGKTWSMAYDLGHNMTMFRNPAGETQSYDFDADDRLFHHVDAMGAEEFFHYDIAGRQSVVTEKLGGDRLVQFDDEGRATLEGDPVGNVTRATYNADNDRTAVTDSRGNTTAYEYDTDGNLVKQTNPDGGVVVTTWDASGHPLSQTDPAGATTAYSYDSHGNLLETRRAVGGRTEVTTNTYDGNGQVLSVTDSNGGETRFTWNVSGTLASRTDEAGATASTTTDPLGRVTGITDAGGNNMALTYDNGDRITSVRDPYGNETTFTYDDVGRRAKIHTPRGDTLYAYDAEGRVIGIEEPLGRKSSTVYDAAGNVIAQTDARGDVTRYEYDLAGRVVRMIDANGGIWAYGYCAALAGNGGSDNFCLVTDPSGNTIKQEFDAMGRVLSVTDSMSHSLSTQYDKLGRKTAETDANGNVTRYTYDEAGQLISVREANDALTTYAYDGNGNKITQRDANGHVWAFKYDASNRLIEERDPLNRVTAYTYDAVGNLKTRTDAKGQTLTYDYDIRRLVKITYPDNSTDVFTYDALGRRISAANANATMTYAYNALNQVTSVTNQRYGLTATYEYDAAGNRTKMTVPRSSNAVFTVKYTYDAKNRLTTIDDATLGVFRLAYDAMDRRTSLKFPNGLSTSYTYDNAYRLTAMVSKNELGTVADAWAYQYDAAGNRTARTDMNGKSDVYRYDNVHRLTDVTYADGAFEKFTYDKVGNRLTLAGPGGTTTYSYDVANQLLTAGSDVFAYDANGNVTTKTTSAGTTTFTYDFKNRLLNANGPDGRETNVYDADGTRIDMSGAPIENGQVRVFSDLNGNPVLDYGTDNQVWTYRVYGPGVDEPLAEYRRTNGRMVYLLHDGSGSVTAMTATDGRVMARYNHRAFGAETRTDNEAGANPPSRLSYTCRERSVGSLMSYRSRHYDTSTGRFLQQDSERGSVLAPPSLQRYIYVFNNPVNYIDPDGHNPVLLVAVGIALALAIAWAVATIGLMIVWGALALAGEPTDEIRSAVGWCALIALIFITIWLILEYGVIIWAVTVAWLKRNISFIGPSHPSTGRVFGIVLKGRGSIQLHRPHAGPHDYWHIQISVRGDTRGTERRIPLRFIDNWLKKHFPI